MRKLFNYIWSKLLFLTNRIDYIPAITPSFPSKGQINDDKIYIVGNDILPKWIVMKCPCGCHELLTLSLMPSHRPYWKLKKENSRITLSPSVWKTDGCQSHFFIRKGKVVWAKE